MKLADEAGASRLETVSEQFRLDQMQLDLTLARYPVIAVSSITEGGVTLAPTDYEVDLARGIVSRLINDRHCHWSRCKITVVVVYRAVGWWDAAQQPPPRLTFSEQSKRRRRPA